MFEGIKEKLRDIKEDWHTRPRMNKWAKRGLMVGLGTVLTFGAWKGQVNKNIHEQEDHMKDILERIVHPDAKRPQNTADFEKAKEAMLSSREGLKDTSLTERAQDSLKATALFNENIMTVLGEKHEIGHEIVNNIEETAETLKHYDAGYYIDAEGKGIVDPNKHRLDEWNEAKQAFTEMFKSDEKEPASSPQLKK